MVQNLLPDKVVNERAKIIAKRVDQEVLHDHRERMVRTFEELPKWDTVCPNGLQLSEAMLGKRPKGEIPPLQVHQYLARLDLAKDAIAEDLGLPTEDIVIVDQPAFHLDMAMAAGPGGVVLLQGYGQSIALLQELHRKAHENHNVVYATFGIQPRPPNRPQLQRSLSMERLRKLAPEHFPPLEPKRLQRSHSSGNLMFSREPDPLLEPKRLEPSLGGELIGSGKSKGGNKPKGDEVDETYEKQLHEIRERLEKYLEAAFALAAKMQNTEERICAQLKAAGFVGRPVAGCFAYNGSVAHGLGMDTVYIPNIKNKLVNFFNHVGGSIRLGGGPNPKYKQGQMFYITNAATGPLGRAFERHFEKNVLWPLGYDHVIFLGRKDAAAERSLVNGGALRCLTTVVPQFEMSTTKTSVITKPIDIQAAFKALKSDVADEKKRIDSMLLTSTTSDDQLNLALALSVIDQIVDSKTLDDCYRAVRSLPKEADISTMKDPDKYDYVVSCLYDSLTDVDLLVPIARPMTEVAKPWKKLGDFQLTKIHQDLLTTDLHDYLDDRIIDAFVTLVEQRRAGVHSRYEVPVGLLVGSQRWMPTLDFQGIRGLGGNARVEVQVINQGGNHWVVGVRYPAESQTAVYVYDPLQPLEIGVETARQMRRCFNLDQNAPITRLAGPRQPYGYECGAYVCAAIEVLTRANLTPAEVRAALEFSAPNVARTFDNDTIRGNINASINGDDVIGF